MNSIGKREKLDSHEAMQSSTPLSAILDESLRSLPADLTDLMRAVELRWPQALEGNLLERLLVTLLNENDVRISTLTTKCQALSIFMSLVLRNHHAKSRVRLALQSVTEWLEWNPSDRKEAALAKELVDLMAIAWNIQSPLRIRTQQDVMGKKASLEEAKQRFQREFAVVQFQAAARSFLARRWLRQTLHNASHEQTKRIEDWSVVLIQKVARGYIARKTVIRSLRIRNTLSHEVLRLAERYLSKGDLWSFLRDINEELERSRRDLSLTEQREESWASTFVDKVIQRRHQEFDQAWKQFPQALSTVGGDTQSFGTLGAASDVADANLPGPLIRRAVSTTVQAQVQKELAAALQSSNRTRSLVRNIVKAYGKDSVQRPSTLPAVQSKRSREPPFASPGQSRGRRTGHGVSASSSQPQPHPSASLSTLSTANWLCTQQPSSSSSAHLSLDSLLGDIPLGLDDNLERLLHAAALRCYVPDFFQSSLHRASESDGGTESIQEKDSPYTWYRRLPAGLARVRYETQCKQWAQAAINRLRGQGLVDIAQVGPVSKLVVCLKGVDAPPALVRMAAEIYLELKNMRKGARGEVSTHTGAEERTEASVEQSTIQAKSPGRTSRTQSFASPAPRATPTTPAHPSSDCPPAASQLLEKMIEQVHSNSLQSTVEEVLVHAAFLVLPHTGPTSSPEMGQHGFQEFAADLIDDRHTDMEREEMIRQRFRAAIMLTTPFSLKLKEKHILSTKELMETDLRPLQIPPALHTQLEIFFNTVTYRQAQARILPVLRDHASRKTPDQFMVPMFYDTRYQRTPLDVFGKTPLRSKVRSLPSEKGVESSELEKEERSASLWSSAQQEQEDEELRVPEAWRFSSEVGKKSIRMGQVAKEEKSRTKSTTTAARTTEKRASSPSPSSPAAAAAFATAAPFVYDDPTVFKNTFVCHYPHCNAVFSRAYTYKVHLRSHENFPQYHNYKRDPQLVLDGVRGIDR